VDAVGLDIFALSEGEREPEEKDDECDKCDTFPDGKREGVETGVEGRSPVFVVVPCGEALVLCRRHGWLLGGSLERVQRLD
jgi:hypothetical protein